MKYKVRILLFLEDMSAIQSAQLMLVKTCDVQTARRKPEVDKIIADFSLKSSSNYFSTKRLLLSFL